VTARPRGAGELLRSVGLLADGPTGWGTPVRSVGPGVYVVELPAPPASAPIDFAVIGRWLELVPGLTLDGSRPTGRELAARLHRFWLADQPVLYIGMSKVSVGSRVGAYYRTALGDPRPHAGGHWLKTLSGLDKLRVWWAETDAPEEYEDALLSAFAAGVPAEVAAAIHDPTVVLPFANLQTAFGERKAHGIRGALLEREPSGPPTPAERVAAARRAGVDGRSLARAGVGRAADGAPGRRKAAPQKAAPTEGRNAVRPPTRLTESGLTTLRAELHEMTNVTRPAVVARIKAARELGDLRENAEYQEARREQSFLEGRVQAIEELLRRVEIIEGGSDDGRVRLGSTVDVDEEDGITATYAVVGTTESDPAAGRVSTDSPIGTALLGRSAGDEVEVVTPSGRLRYRIVAVR
jgi:transcription elongation factor GreA